MGYRARCGRIVRRVGCCVSGGADRFGIRQRYRRLDSQSRALLRRVWTQTDVWSCGRHAQRAARQVHQSGFGCAWTASAQRRRHGVANAIARCAECVRYAACTDEAAFAAQEAERFSSRVAVSEEISARCQTIGESLAKLGATVSGTARPRFDTNYASNVYRKLLDAATNPNTELKHSEWLALDNERQKIRLAWREFFNDWDIVIAPICATTAFPHDHSAYQGRTLKVDDKAVPYFQQIYWASLATLSYLPSTCFPTGLSKNGLPIGLQAIGKGYDDLITIDFARQLAQEIGGFVAPPGYYD
jgi:Asp-tRNA(Asn)/Glu-tRNA(Gln) amidotransferase A subunit family amidase